MKTVKHTRDIDLQICQRLQALRRQHKLTQERTAELIDVTTKYYGQIERGERPLTLAIAGRLCHHYHITYDYLYLGQLREDPVLQMALDPTTSRGMLLEIIKEASAEECDAYLTLLKAARRLCALSAPE